jgi:phage terminase large subunit-like protein
VLLVRHQTIYILDVIRARLEYPDLKRAVLENYRLWYRMTPSCDLVIEKKGSGLSLIQDLLRDDINCGCLSAHSHDLLPLRDCTNCKEILSFPVSKHDDQIDALSQALQRASTPEPPIAVFGTYNKVR